MMNEHVLHLVVFLISALVVTICVVVHYEALRFLSRTVGIHVHRAYSEIQRSDMRYQVRIPV